MSLFGSELEPYDSSKTKPLVSSVAVPTAVSVKKEPSAFNYAMLFLLRLPLVPFLILELALDGIKKSSFVDLSWKGVRQDFVNEPISIIFAYTLSVLLLPISSTILMLRLIGFAAEKLKLKQRLIGDLEL